MQVGKVVRIGKQPMSMSIEAGGAAARPAGTPNPGLILGFEVSPIFNFHLGPGQKVKVRGKKALRRTELEYRLHTISGVGE